MDNIQKVLEDFTTNGYAIILNFLNQNEIEGLKQECNRIIDKMNINGEHAIFSTGKWQPADYYLITWGNQILWITWIWVILEWDNIRIPLFNLIS